MTPISLTWDSREKVILIKWNGFFSFGWKEGKRVKTIFKIPIPYRPGAKRDKKIHFPRVRWIYLKEVFSVLREWKLKRAEGTLSFQDPMVNGILYGCLSTFGPKKENRNINVTINFLGENWCSGEGTISPKVAFHCFKRCFSLFLRKGRKLPKGGE
jgi:hypothetical protein